MSQLWPVANYVSAPEVPDPPVFTDVITDVDAINYIAQVEIADGQPLEFGVKLAINNLVLGLKGRDHWTNLNHLTLLAGPKTLNGLAVPLKGTAATLNNFVIGDYDRKTGLLGDGSTKFIDSNVQLTSIFASDGGHVGVRVIRSSLINSAYIGAQGATTTTGGVQVGVGSSTTTFAARVLMQTSSTYTNTVQHNADGLYCASKTLGGGFRFITPSLSTTSSYTLTTTTTATNIYVFANNNNGIANNYSNGRIGLYFLGKGFPSTDSDVINLRNIVNKYFTDLNSVTLT